jgi:hypothetical protein
LVTLTSAESVEELKFSREPSLESACENIGMPSSDGSDSEWLECHSKIQIGFLNCKYVTHC